MRSLSNFDWTEERVTLLRELLHEGKSGSMIARELGTSRNSVIGKVHRLQKQMGIGLGGSISKSEKCTNATVRQKAVQKIAPLVVKPTQHRFHSGNLAAKKASRVNDPVLVEAPVVSKLAFEADSLRVLLHELEPRQCKWEVNNAPVGEDHLFCGKRTDEGKSWCPYHANLAYVPRPPKPIQARAA
ncbi:hypothetical protein HQ945_08515 [Phyllobacterium sp. BT25]|uniref:GcrA cell cycle regulator n=1 Tax=Phyllobacterium pellucidum TaxID=2740464 RepID=A0A849VT75_9HYPH|nr:GcrA family cell cycle regulator [Phyllobacterium pellucidum]NTS31297.1 hypothetical protein [Phyllobacterium pellucidum]